MRDATEAVMRQGMEYRRGFPLKPALGASTQDSFDHARENAERESGNREEGQRCHRQASPRSTIPPIFMEARSAFSAGGRGAAVYQVRGRSFRFQTAAGAHDHLRGGRRRQHRDRSETYRDSGLAAKEQHEATLVSLRRELPGSLSSDGAPGGIRTPDPRLRRPMLYPTELQARAVATIH
jgi:hypothetical protein